MTRKKQPWEESSAWKTEAVFWQWVRGALRRALWARYPVRNEFKKELTWNVTEAERKEHKLGARVRKVGMCSLTKGIFPASQLEIDHIKPVGRLSSWEDLPSWIDRLLCPKENMRLVSKDAHKIHTYAEKMGLTFQEASIEKEVIAFSKLTIAQQKTILKKRRVAEDSMSTVAKRKEAYRRILKGGQK